MLDIALIAGRGFDLLMVILGFGSIIFVHELGHFLAARWAGIRVLAFAIGFGPSILTYRKGLGIRRGSSEAEYIAWLRANKREGVNASGSVSPAISPTEYRLNALPLGGYVKMLGQEDLDPTATSQAPDSYQNCPVGKRMVVISAGVVMNVITAIILFIIVFMVGLKTEPPVIGDVIPGKPAARAVPIANANTPQSIPTTITPHGLLPGDRILTINNKPAASFNDLILATGMSGPKETIELKVLRTPIVSTPSDLNSQPQELRFSLTPETSRISGLREIGVSPARSSTVFPVRSKSERALFDQATARLGLSGLEPGSTLVRVGTNTNPVSSASIREAAAASKGSSIELEFKLPSGSSKVFSIATKPQYFEDLISITPGEPTSIEHILGLASVMNVASSDEETRGYKLGLREGDIFARVGAIEFPRLDQGMREIRANKNKSIRIIVIRKAADGSESRVDLGDIKVTGEGTIGFSPSSAAEISTILARPYDALTTIKDVRYVPSAAALSITPGSHIVSVAGNNVKTFEEAAERFHTEALKSAAFLAAPIAIVIIDPSGAWINLTITPTADESARLRSLVWQSPIGSGLFEPEQFLLKGDGPLDAISMGAGETRRVMLMTYMTFVRLFQGTVKIEHLRGPVGIAHTGTILAERGFIWLLFYLALISINLAVINFLPIPIVDGGQFIFLVFEWLRGKPIPVQIQNFVTIAGLICIGCIFLLVTYNDIKNLFGL